MRCLLVLALCLTVASASFYNKNRFQRLLNRYQNQNRFGQNQYGSRGQNLLGSDDVDDYIDDYVDEIRRQRMLDRDQCPRDSDSILGGCGLEDEQGDWTDLEGTGGDLEGFQGDQRRGQRGRAGLQGMQGDLNDITGDLEGFQGGQRRGQRGWTGLQGLQGDLEGTGGDLDDFQGSQRRGQRRGQRGRAGLQGLQGDLDDITGDLEGFQGGQRRGQRGRAGLQGMQGDLDDITGDLEGFQGGQRRGLRGLTDLDDTQGLEGFQGRQRRGQRGWTGMGGMGGDLDDIQGDLEGLSGGLEDIRGFQDEQDQTSSARTLLREVRDANCRLASRLYKQSKDERDDKNTVVSPLSIQLALAALNYGARGNTKRQIAHVYAGNLKLHERRQIFHKLIRNLKGFGRSGYSSPQQMTQIKPVTGIFVNKMTPGQQHFIQLIKNNLGATVKHCNFQQQPQQCRQQINTWMAQKTQANLRHIVPQDAVTDNTKMILVNGMHIKATWGSQMRQRVTKEAKFYPLGSKKVKVVQVLETQGRFKYHENELCKVVGVPTQQQEVTLYVIVPKDKDGLSEVEKLHLQDNVQLKELLQQTDRHVRRVGVQLPKFQIKHKLDVRRTLRNQGVTDAFDPLRADFSGITGVGKYGMDEMEDQTYADEFGQSGRSRRNQLWGSEQEMSGPWQIGAQGSSLHLNKFIHQSTIKITENGITAASGSGNQIEDYEGYGLSRQGRMGMGMGAMGGTGMWESDEMNTFDEISGFNLRQTGDRKFVKANRAFAFVVKHNPTNQIVFVGRVIDAAQKKVNHVPETIDSVDQF